MTPIPKLDSVCFITIISKQIFEALPTWICIFCLHVGKKFRERLQENNIHTHTGDILHNKQIGTLQAMKKNMR